MTTVPGLFAGGEANFSDHGANRLGASALMQGLADGYFVLPSTVSGYLGSTELKKVTTDAPEFKAAEKAVKEKITKLLSINGEHSVDYYHKKLGKIMWDNVGMSRNEAGLKSAISEIKTLREDFWKNVRVLGEGEELNQSLEKAGRVADFLELGELLATDALNRRESCGGHFREESQTEDNEAKRDDENFSYVAAWEFKGEGTPAELHKEDLTFEHCKPSQRSYK
jgi:succinate dehydrogenase / fumarate reductase flavoprotein subunit